MNESDRTVLLESVGQSLQRISLASITSLCNEDVGHILETFPYVRDIDFSGCFIESTTNRNETGLINLPARPQLSFRSLLSSLRALSTVCFGGAPLYVTLRLNSTGITDRDLEFLCCCDFIHLRGLLIENCRNLTDRGLLAVLSSVQLVGQLKEISLGLPSPDINFSTFLPVFKAIGPNLKRLCLSKLPISSKSQLSSLLSSCSNVEHLDISSCCTGFIGWSEYLWMNLHCISSLDLSGHFTLTDEDVSVMSLSLKCRLKYLNVSSCMKLTDLSLEVICRNFSSTLEVLNANWCKGFSDAGFQGTQGTSVFSTGVYTCTRLKELNFSDCHQITGRSFAPNFGFYIPPFQNLARLHLGRTGLFKGDDLINAASFAPFLQYLDVSRSSVDDDSLNTVLQKLHRTLRQLFVSGCDRITDLTLNNIISSIPYLRVLDVSFCPHISHEGLRNFRGCMSYLIELKALYIGAAVNHT
ncbi:unnamed protein product [Echinostoma caproni]|uniref:F-box domain-containing protein n=1 Tax=Echinostoma caproni TaxID=27848 RepID=A0A183BAJ0_9TREM|nr:unnamed protein product [Echinostoma caproni]